MLATLKAGGDIRADKVADIRAQIDSGTYETDDKVNGALDGLLDDMNL
jgi:anti-sigma28 factor (negative regulator of flagellin synthesis)